MSSKDKLTEAVAKRKAALQKKAGNEKASADNVRTTRKQLKRAQRKLAKLERFEEATAKAKPEAEAPSEK